MPHAKALTSAWQGLDLGMTEQCPGLFPGSSYPWQKENPVSSEGTESLCHLQSKWELLPGKGEAASITYGIQRAWRRPREEGLGESVYTRFPVEGQGGRCHCGDRVPSSSFHPCCDICICWSHGICLALAGLLCGICFIHNNSQQCYFCDLLPFGVYLTLSVLRFSSTIV